MNISTLLTGVVTLLWLGVVGLIILIVVRASRGYQTRGLNTATVVAAALAIVMTLSSAGIVFLQPEERGVVISAVAPGGYRKEALGPGIHWIIPFAENVVRYQVSKQTYTMSISASEGQIQGDDSITARTSDGQEIFVDASVIYMVDPEQVVDVHITWQDRYDEDLVRPQTRGIIRDVVSQYRVDEVVSTKRLEMTSLVSERMAAKLKENGLIMADFVLRNITFSPDYAVSVEQKQIAEQQSQQAKFVVESKKQEAEQARQVAEGRADAAVIEAKGAAEARLIEAKAEAEALRLINETIQDNPDLLTYQYITKLSPSIETMLLPSNSPFILNLPNQSATGSQAPTPVPTPIPTTEPTVEP